MNRGLNISSDALYLTNRVTAGMENHLLYYVCLENGCGLVMSPSNDQISTQPVHSLLLDTFRETALTIHTILHQKRLDDSNYNWEEDDVEVGVACFHSYMCVLL